MYVSFQEAKQNLRQDHLNGRCNVTWMVAVWFLLVRPRRASMCPRGLSNILWLTS